MTSILDIDLDYFNLFDDPLERLNKLLAWANRPVDKIVDHHHKSFKYWKKALAKRSLAAPQYILHVDEHHDMIGDAKPIQFGNFLYFAMREWPDCRVHWQVNGRIDSPRMWLSEEAWDSVASRFTMGPGRKRGWPKPDIVTVCTSPGFLDESLTKKLVGALNLSQREPGEHSTGKKTVSTVPRGQIAKSNIAWFVYIVRCADGSLYTGITNNVPRRFKQHNAGTASRYTRSRLPVELVYQESQASQSLALKRELAIKAMTRQKKESLIRSSG